MQFEVRDARSKNRYFIDNDFFDTYGRILGANAIAVYNALCRHSNRKQEAWPSQGSMAETTRLGRQEVNRVIAELEGLNIIRKERVGKKSTNRYWLLDKSEWLTPVVMSSQATSRRPAQKQSDVVSGDITGMCGAAPETTPEAPRRKTPPHDKIVIPPPTKNCGQIVDKSGVMSSQATSDVVSGDIHSNKTHRTIQTNPSYKVPPKPRTNRGHDKIVREPGGKKGSYRHKTRSTGGEG